jgi:hypothetical protein
MVTRRRVVAGSIGGLLLSSLSAPLTFGAAEPDQESLAQLPASGR